MNLKLLNRIKRKITSEPKQFMMWAWYNHNPDAIPHCGTAACIGGWAVAMVHKVKPSEASKRYKEGLFTRATKALKLDESQARRLFVMESWPWKFREKYRDYDEIKNASHNARVAVQRINHFIKTKGAE